MEKIKTYLAAGRWFAAPFFGSALLIGCALAGGFFTWNAWIGLIAGLLVMAGGHVLNSWGDWMTNLDQGTVEERSAEKAYTGGSNFIARGKMSLRETFLLGIIYYLLALIPIIYLAMKVTWLIIPVAIVGMCITLWYSLISKFNWTHELALGTGCGPVAVLMGMFAVSAHPDIIRGILISYPYAIILSFAGLALDEWPDAEANIPKGVKSIAFMVWGMADWVVHAVPTSGDPTGVNHPSYVKDVNILRWYIGLWIIFMFVYQNLLISIGYLKPLTAIAWIIFFPMMATMVFFSGNYRKAAGVFVAIAALYPILLLVGQVIGG